MGMFLIALKIIVSIVTLTILYLISIKPRLYGRPDYRPFFGHMYAHRGLHNMNPAIQRLKNIGQPAKDTEKEEGCFPENSYAAIKRAADLGYGIEFDVHLTKDDIPVVFHDDTLNRICGVKGNLRDYTFEELQQFRLLGTQECIPAFADILKMIDGRVPLIIEYKVEKMQTSSVVSATAFSLTIKGCIVLNRFIRWQYAGTKFTDQTLCVDNSRKILQNKN